MRSVFEWGWLLVDFEGDESPLGENLSGAMKQKIVLAPLAIHFQGITLIFMSLDDSLQSVAICRPVKYSNGTSFVEIHVVFK